MAKKRRPRLGENATRHAQVALHPGRGEPVRHMSLAAIGLGLSWLAVVAVLYVLGPEFPWLLQKLLGIVLVGLLVLVYMVATRHVETAEETMFRLRRGQSADFGRRIRAAAQEPWRVRLPVLGEVRCRTLGAVFVGLLGIGWWLTPLAPVSVRKLTVEDLTFRLTDEIKALIVVMADESVVLPQPPIVPPRARELAERITQQRDSYQWALKATAQGRFEDARALLDVASEKKNVELDRIHLARAINEMYAARFADATHWYQQLLVRRADDPDLLCQAAVAWMQAGEFREAEPLIEHAAEVCQEKFSKDEEAWAPVLHARAVFLLAYAGKFDQAQTAANESRRIWSEARGANHRFVAASLNNQATIYLMQANYSGAQELCLWARDSWTKSLGEANPYVAAALGNLAQLHAANGAYNRARDLLERADQIRKQAVRDQLLPEDHPILALSSNPLTRLAVTLGRYETTEATALQTLQIAPKRLGPEHPLVGAAAETLGALYAAEARHSKAERSYQRALAIYEKAWPEQHPALAAAISDLAELYLAQQRIPRVKEALDRLQAIVEERYGKEDPRTAATLVLRGRFHTAVGELREARADLEKALQLQTAVYGEKHPEIVRTLGYLAALNHGAGTAVYLRGVEEYEKAIAMAEEFFGDEHPEIARLQYGLAELHITAGKFAEARTSLKRALDIQKETLTPFHPELAATYSAYARVLAEGQPAAPRAAAEMRRRAQEVLTLYEQENRLE